MHDHLNVKHLRCKSQAISNIESDNNMWRLKVLKKSFLINSTMFRTKKISNTG